MTAALLCSIALFCIGLYGVLSRRDLLHALIGVLLMMSGITVLAVALAAAYPATGTAAYSFVLVAWAVEVLEIVIGLAVFLMLARDGADLDRLRVMRW